MPNNDYEIYYQGDDPLVAELTYVSETAGYYVYRSTEVDSPVSFLYVRKKYGHDLPYDINIIIDPN